MALSCSGREFMVEVKKQMTKHDVRNRTGIMDVHRDQGIVERLNRTLSARLFSFQIQSGNEHELIRKI